MWLFPSPQISKMSPDSCRILVLQKEAFFKSILKAHSPHYIYSIDQCLCR